LLQDNPGLKSQFADIIANAYRLAKVDASRETGLDRASFPTMCPWSVEQLMDEAFFPD
jgi:hypothetical protein